MAQIISDLDPKELVLIGDLNWNWLQPVSEDFKAYCNLINLFQKENSPNRPNLKCPENSSLIDLIIMSLITIPWHLYSLMICDHCVVATVRNTKILKSKQCIIIKRDMKHFKQQAFLLGKNESGSRS